MHRKSRLIPILKLLNELYKEMKCEACQEFWHFFVTSLINLIIQEHDCEVIFIVWPENYFKSRLEIAWNYAFMLPNNYMRNHYGRHYIV